MDAIAQLRQLRASLMRELRHKPCFWIDNFDLSRHEFTTKTRQVLAGRGHAHENLDALVSVALEEYDQHWREKDEEVLSGSLQA